MPGMVGCATLIHGQSRDCRNTCFSISSLVMPQDHDDVGEVATPDATSVDGSCVMAVDVADFATEVDADVATDVADVALPAFFVDDVATDVEAFALVCFFAMAGNGKQWRSYTHML